LANQAAGGSVYLNRRKGIVMNRFDWTFSGSAELITGLLLAAAIIAAAFA
jgi:hypothetical protein